MFDWVLNILLNPNLVSFVMQSKISEKLNVEHDSR